jgi:hypothetical protein
MSNKPKKTFYLNFKLMWVMEIYIFSFFLRLYGSFLEVFGDLLTLNFNKFGWSFDKINGCIGSLDGNDIISWACEREHKFLKNILMMWIAYSWNILSRLNRILNGMAKYSTTWTWMKFIIKKRCSMKPSKWAYFR